MRIPLFTFRLFVAAALLIAVGAGCKNRFFKSVRVFPNEPDTKCYSAEYCDNGRHGILAVTITVAVGTTVSWKNTDGIAHTSTSDSGVWDTGNMPAGSTQTTTFNTAGTFAYHCTYHASMGMRGTVIVK